MTITVGLQISLINQSKIMPQCNKAREKHSQSLHLLARDRRSAATKRLTPLTLGQPKATLKGTTRKKFDDLNGKTRRWLPEYIYGALAKTSISVSLLHPTTVIITLNLLSIANSDALESRHLLRGIKPSSPTRTGIRNAYMGNYRTHNKPNL